jgi:hypothetical protein
MTKGYKASRGRGAKGSGYWVQGSVFWVQRLKVLSSKVLGSGFVGTTDTEGSRIRGETDNKGAKDSGVQGFKGKAQIKGPWIQGFKDSRGNEKVLGSRFWVQRFEGTTDTEGSRIRGAKGSREYLKPYCPFRRRRFQFQTNPQ